MTYASLGYDKRVNCKNSKGVAWLEPLACTRCGRKIGPRTRYRRTRKGILCQPCLNALWKAKGYAAERDLVKRLRKLGYNAIRMAVSGAGTEPVPDVCAFHPEKREALAFEVKSVTARRWTVFSYKDKEKKKEGQIIKALKWLKLMYPDDVTKKAGVAIKFLLGERRKSPWIIKFVEDPGDLTKLDNVMVDITDYSDMPQLSKTTRSKRARKIIRQRKRKLKT